MAKKKEGDDVLTAGEQPDPGVDEKINSTGADTPTVQPPSVDKAVRAEIVEERYEDKHISEEDLKVMLRYLASHTLNPVAYQDFLQAFPKLKE